MKPFRIRNIIKAWSPAWILPYTLSLLTLIALLLSSARTIQSKQNDEIQQLIHRQQMMAYVSSGLNHLLHQPLTSATEYRQAVDLGRYRLSMMRKSWGFLHVIGCRVESRGDSAEQLILAASYSSPDTVLVIDKQNGNLAYCGQVTLQGNCRLQFPALSALESDARPQLRLRGRIDTNERESLDGMYCEFRALAALAISDPQMGILPAGSIPAEAEQVLDGESLLIRAEGELILKSQSLHGRILIISADRITVEAGADLRDCILIAPTIRFKPGCSVRVQAFARDSIIVGNSSHLQYPSVLIIAADSESIAHPGIVMQKQSRVEGMILISPDSSRAVAGSSFFMHAGALIRGHLISLVPIDSELNIEGRLSCYSVQSAVGSRTYRDLLKSTTVQPASGSSIIGSVQASGPLHPIRVVSSKLNIR